MIVFGVMSEMTDVAEAVHSAVKAQFESVEDAGIKPCNDGSYDVTVNVRDMKNAPMSQDADTGSDTPEKGGDTQDVTDDTERAGDGDTQDDTPENPGTAWGDVSYNVNRKISSMIEDKTDKTAPRNGESGQYADFLEGVEGVHPTPELAQVSKCSELDAEMVDYDTTSDESDTPENDQTEDTPDAGGVRITEEDGRKMYHAKGESMRYTTLSSKVSDMDVNWPEDTTGENLLEIYSEGQSVSDTTESTSDEDTPEGVPSRDTLMSRGVDAEHLDTVVKLYDKNGECQKEGCPMGANDDCDYCHWCDNGKKSPAMSATDPIDVCYRDLDEEGRQSFERLANTTEMDTEEILKVVAEKTE